MNGVTTDMNPRKREKLTCDVCGEILGELPCTQSLGRKVRKHFEKKHPMINPCTKIIKEVIENGD
jgi:hypothetical protein